MSTILASGHDRLCVVGLLAGSVQFVGEELDESLIRSAAEHGEGMATIGLQSTLTNLQL